MISRVDSRFFCSTILCPCVWLKRIQHYHVSPNLRTIKYILLKQKKLSVKLFWIKPNIDFNHSFSALVRVKINIHIYMRVQIWTIAACHNNKPSFSGRWHRLFAFRNIEFWLWKFISHTNYLWIRSISGTNTSNTVCASLPKYIIIHVIFTELFNFRWVCFGRINTTIRLKWQTLIHYK